MHLQQFCSPERHLLRYTHLHVQLHTEKLRAGEVKFLQELVVLLQLAKRCPGSITWPRRVALPCHPPGKLSSAEYTACLASSGQSKGLGGSGGRGGGAAGRAAFWLQLDHLVVREAFNTVMNMKSSGCTTSTASSVLATVYSQSAGPKRRRAFLALLEGTCRVSVRRLLITAEKNKARTVV